jgi:hypothetical protein
MVLSNCQHTMTYPALRTCDEIALSDARFSEFSFWSGNFCFACYVYRTLVGHMGPGIFLMLWGVGATLEASGWRWLVEHHKRKGYVKVSSQLDCELTIALTHSICIAQQQLQPGLARPQYDLTYDL